MKAIVNAANEWFHRQRAFVQIAVIFSIAFVVVACLMAAFA